MGPSHILRPIPSGRLSQTLRILATSLLLAIVLSIVTVALLKTDRPLLAETNEITAVHSAFGIEYSVPNGPRNLVAEAPGRIWYTGTDSDGIGFLEVTSPPGDPNVRYRTEFYGLAKGSQVYDLVYSDGFVWFTLRGMRSLGKIDVVTREITLYPLLTVGAAPTGIDTDNIGRLWIAQSNGRVSRFDPTTETFTEFPLAQGLIGRPYVEDLVYQNDRNIWFTMPDANTVVVYNSITDRFFNVPTGEFAPTNIQLDAEGRPWVTAYGSDRVGRYTPTTVSTWIWFNTPSTESGPTGLLVFDEPAGVRQVWVSESKRGRAGRIQIYNSFEVSNRETLGLASPAGTPWGIIRSQDKHIWIADTSRNVLYEVAEPYIQRVYAASIFKD